VAMYSGFTLGSYTFNPSQSAPLTQTVNAIPPPPPPPVIPSRVIAVGAEAGTLPEVRVFDPITKVVKLDFFAFPIVFRGGVRVAVGDIDGDGVLDIICGAGPGGGPEVRVFSGATGALIRDFFGVFPTSFTGGVYVAAGDVNGDGIADMIVGA